MQQQFLNKDKALEEMKVLSEVSSETLKDDHALTYQLGVTIVTNGQNMHKTELEKAFKAMKNFLAQAPTDWLFQPQIMVQSADLAGDSLKKALSDRQAAKDSIVKSSDAKS